MMDFVDIMEEYFAERVGFHLLFKCNAPTTAVMNAWRVIELSVEEGAECLKVPKESLLKAVVLAQEDWMEELANRLL